MVWRRAASHLAAAAKYCPAGWERTTFAGTAPSLAVAFKPLCHLLHRAHDVLDGSLGICCQFVGRLGQGVVCGLHACQAGQVGGHIRDHAAQPALHACHCAVLGGQDGMHSGQLRLKCRDLDMARGEGGMRQVWVGAKDGD